MFHSLDSLLKQSQATDIHKIWIKYFTKEKLIPKDFLTFFPQFTDSLSIFNFHPIETRLLKKNLININDPNTLSLTLVRLFGLEDPIPEQFLIIFLKIGNLINSKESKKSRNVLFHYAFRYFIIYTHQLSLILINIIDKGQEIPKSYEFIYKILFFFFIIYWK